MQKYLVLRSLIMASFLWTTCLFLIPPNSAPAAEKAVPSWKGKWVDSVVWSGDLRLRYEQFWNYGVGTVADDRVRWRMRLRFGPTIKMQDFEVGFRLATSSSGAGGSGDQVSTNQSFDNAFSRKPIKLDRAFASWTPQSLGKNGTVIGGKMKNPFKKNYTTDLLFDGDVTPEGFAQRGKFKANDMVTMYADFGQFVLNESSGDTNDPWLFAFEGGANVKMGKNKGRFGIGYFDYTFVDRAGIGEINSQGFSSRQAAGPGGAFVNDFNILLLSGSFDTDIAGLPLNFQGDWGRNLAYDISCSGVGNARGACGAGNFASPNDENTGYQFGVRAGKAKKARTWEVAYYWKHLEADAVLSVFADSDLGNGGTNRRGHIIWVAYSFTDFLKLKAKFFNTKPIDRRLCAGSAACSDDVDRLQVDMVWKF